MVPLEMSESTLMIDVLSTEIDFGDKPGEFKYESTSIGIDKCNEEQKKKYELLQGHEPYCIKNEERDKLKL